MGGLGNKEIFSKNIKYYMYIRNKDRNDLVRDLGFKYSTLSDWINGKIYPRIDKIEALANYFGIEKSDLIEERIVNKKNWYKENAIPVKNNHLVPVFGTIPAGPPMLAVQDIESYEAADVENPLDYFYLRVKGDSMINANIMSGSLVLIKKQNCAEDGNIVACIVNGDEATLKRYKKVGSNILLMPENNKYQPIIVNADDFKNGYAYILGVATEVKFKL